MDSENRLQPIQRQKEYKPWQRSICRLILPASSVAGGGESDYADNLPLPLTPEPTGRLQIAIARSLQNPPSVLRCHEASHPGISCGLEFLFCAN